MKVVIGDEDSGQVEYYETKNNSLVKILNYHLSKIEFLKYLPLCNGYVASASTDKSVHVWDPNTWSSIRVYSNHTEAVYGLDQIDNDTIVSVSRDTHIHLWKISTGELFRKINAGADVYAVKALLHRQQIACGLAGSSNNLKIYNYSTNQLHVLVGHTNSVRCIELLNKDLIASGSSNSSIIIWDLTTYSIRFTLTGHENEVKCIKFLSSSLMASGDLNGLIIIWNWVTGERIHTLVSHTSSLEYSSLDLYDQQTLISGSWDKTVKFWNITNGSLIQSINVNFRVSTLAMIKRSEQLTF